MFKSTKEFDKAVFDFLTAINNSGSFEEIQKKLSNEELDDIVEYCCLKGFVNGLEIIGKTLSGKIRYTIKGNIRLSYSGLSFIERYKD